jgi:hypothetical protein
VTGCGSSSSSTTSATSAAGTPAAATTTSGSTSVLPVAKNPISNPATATGLTITKALVENNISPTNGKTVDDHLEFVLKNTSAKPLDQIEVYYKITDPSFHICLGLALALRDGQISDFPLCNKSFNLSYCGHDL